MGVFWSMEEALNSLSTIGSRPDRWGGADWEMISAPSYIDFFPMWVFELDALTPSSYVKKLK